MTATRRELGIGEDQGQARTRGAWIVETGRFRCDDGDAGCPGTTAAETKGTQRVDGRLPTPRPARWQIKQKQWAEWFEKANKRRERMWEKWSRNIWTSSGRWIAWQRNGNDAKTFDALQAMAVVDQCRQLRI